MEAIAILQKRFGNVQRIKARHMDVLMNVEAVNSSRDLKSLRRLHDLIESHVRSLSALGIDPATYGGLLSSTLLNKLPSDLQLMISRKLSDTDWDLTAFLKLMGDEIEARERIYRKEPRSVTTQLRKTVDQAPPTATTLVTGTTPTMMSCCYCQQQHPSSTCVVVTHVEARRQILKRSGRCFRCLRKGHVSRECRSLVRCANCNGSHHKSICTRGASIPPVNSATTTTSSADPSNVSKRPHQPSTSMLSQTSQVPLNQSNSLPSQAPLNPEAVSYTALTPTSTSLYVSVSESVFLQTALAEVYDPRDPGLVVKVRLILDSGSQQSYVSNEVREALGLESQDRQCLSIATFGAERESKICETVCVGMKMKYGVDQQLRLFVVPRICEPITFQPMSVSVENCEHLSQLDLADPDCDSPRTVDVLIGSDYYWEFTDGEIRRGTTGPVAMRTKLGWVLSGPGPSFCTGVGSPVVNLLTIHTLTANELGQPTNQDLSNQLRTFWELESLGIMKTDKSVHDDFKENVSFKDGRYEVALPWKEFHYSLPNNYVLSWRRLQGLLKRLRQAPELLKEYDATIQDQLRKGVVEPVPESEPISGCQVHYLPHYAMVRHDKETTRLRVVYDASARAGGPSLNDCLYTGPKFNQNIFDILIRFRSYRIALTADIEKAFLMISIRREDRDSLRFLWVDNLEEKEPKVVTLRFTRVVFGVSSSLFLLNATLKQHLEKFTSVQPLLVHRLSQSLYVDDLVCGASSEHEGYELYRDSKWMLASGSFNLRKFSTNSPQLQMAIDKAESMSQSPYSRPDCDGEETHAKSTVGPHCLLRPGTQKVLGVYWDIMSDHLLFSF